MMMGPTKKKVMLAAIVSFLIPVVVGGFFFNSYKKEKEDEIAKLEIKAETDERYVFARNMVVGEVITSDDIMGVGVKSESVPLDSFHSGDSSGIIGRKMRINAEERTIVAESMFTEIEDENPTIDERLQEFNMILLPSDLNEGDFIDIRITLPTGANYIVISGKEVKKLGTAATSNTIYLQLDEEEILRMTAAVLEAYMSNGNKLYATKYVDPSNQLYSYERVDYVARFETALKNLVEERQRFADEDPEEYMLIYGSGDATNSTASGDKSSSALSSILGVLGEGSIKVKSEDITTAEIASVIGLTVKETQDIRNAIANKNESTLDLYRDRLVTTRKNMVNTYPVTLTVAELIKDNPNILEEIRAEYDLAEITAERLENCLDLAIYKFNDDGELEETSALKLIQDNLTKEIEAQKEERKQYLQALLLAN